VKHDPRFSINPIPFNRLPFWGCVVTEFDWKEVFAQGMAEHNAKRAKEISELLEKVLPDDKE